MPGNTEPLYTSGSCETLHSARGSEMAETSNHSSSAPPKGRAKACTACRQVKLKCDAREVYPQVRVSISISSRCAVVLLQKHYISYDKHRLLGNSSLVIYYDFLMNAEKFSALQKKLTANNCSHVRDAGSSRWIAKWTRLSSGYQHEGS